MCLKSILLSLISSALLIMFLVVLPIIARALDFSLTPKADVNLTHWREHRRKKRFILFENGGICKLVTGITYPVDLGDKKPWRQLVMTYNLQYQFPVPSKPVYWWDKGNTRNLPGGPSIFSRPETLHNYKDEAQEYIYEFAENLMDRWGMNGRACVLRLICENAQIHINQGLYTEIIHRILQPQKNLKSFYTEAWHLGKKGLDCQAVYPEAKKCLLDDYFHVREDFKQQHFVNDRRSRF